MRGIQDSEAKEKETERYLTAAFEGILICQILVPSISCCFLLMSTNQTLRTSAWTRAIVSAKDNILDRWALRNSRFWPWGLHVPVPKVKSPRYHFTIGWECGTILAFASPSANSEGRQFQEYWSLDFLPLFGSQLRLNVLDCSLVLLLLSTHLEYKFQPVSLRTFMWFLHFHGYLYLFSYPHTFDNRLNQNYYVYHALKWMFPSLTPIP